MKVKDLIKQLKKCPQEAEVILERCGAPSTCGTYNRHAGITRVTKFAGDNKIYIENHTIFEEKGNK